MGIAGAGGCGTDSEFSDGNGRYDDGQQRGIGGYLGGIAGGFDQCAGDPGVCCAGSRRNHHLFPVHGTEKYKNATDAAKQLIFIITAIAVVLTVVCVVFQIPLLHLIFGKVEAEVMTNSEVYFLYTALSFPFIAVFNAGSSVFRAQENTRLPMTISVISNIMNIVGNAILIFGFHMGVAGAALSTLISRIFCAIVVMYFLRNPKEEICVRDYIKIRPDRHKIKMILALGIPTGIENGMFQFGKLAIQSTVSTLGTAAIAAQAMTNILENLNGIAAIGIGIGLMNVVGECIGAGRKDEAIYYTKRCAWYLR